MAARSFINHRGFFSDYWLGTLLSQRHAAIPRPTPANARKMLARLTRLLQRVERPDPLDLTQFREQFARPLLDDLFGWRIAEREDADAPRLRLLCGSENPPLAVLCLCPEQERLDQPETQRGVEKAMADTGLDYALVLAPTTLRLLAAPTHGTRRGAAFDLSLAQAVQLQDDESLQAAGMIFAASSFAPDSEHRRPIDLIEAESRRHRARVSDDLKQAVFDAAELVVRGFLRDTRERPDAVSPVPSLTDLRDAALLTLYRLLFVLYAESRDERLSTHTLYWKSYSLDDLTARLLHTADGDLAGNRFGIWGRLLALFRIYNDGLPAMPGFQNIPPRGGRLFDEREPAGRLIATLRLDDRAAARLVLTLAASRPRRGVGRERVSYRELEIEQLGAVYEGLLEYEPATAGETLLHVAVQGREYVLAPAELVRLCERKDLHLKGDASLVEGTDAARLHPELAEEDAPDSEEEEEPDQDEADGGDADEDKGVRKGAAARLLRKLEPGAFFFRPGAARKASGSYYTPTVMVDHLVEQACAGIPADATPDEIENLRVIDLACGSAHFLVGAARHLGARLFAAHRRRSSDPPEAFHPYRDLTPAVRDEWSRLGPAWCKRRVVERCLFGVDLNPTAVQLAQVALWIESLAGDRPLSFFAHHIRCGNSLVGTWSDRLQMPPLPDYDRQMAAGQRGLFEHDIQQTLNAALAARRLIEAPLPDGYRPDTPEEYEYKQDRLATAERVIGHARLLFDLRCAAIYIPAIWREWPTLLGAADLEAEVSARPWAADFAAVRARERFFHWELEFPEVFAGERKGFDIVLGNPPWEKVKPDRKEFYGAHDVLIRAYTGGELDARIRELQAAQPSLPKAFEAYSDRIRALAQHLKKGGDYTFCDWEIEGRSTGGDPDLFKFFIERAHRILRPGGRLGYLVPSALYNNEGCTGLRHLLLDESRVCSFYGFENRRKLFPIDSRYKFVCLALEKIEGQETQPDFSAAFMRHDPDELKNPPAAVQVLIRRSELERLSPGTLAFLEYRDPRDREIVLKMYGLLDGQTPRPLLGDQGEGTWGVRFYREFDMTNDRDLWTKPDGKLWTPKEVCGLDWPANRSIPFVEVRAAMAAKGFWPLYEGKHIEQFLTDIKPVERWLSIEAARKKNNRPPAAGPKLVFRDIARNTDERTCIAAILPERSCVNNKLPVVHVESGNHEVVAAIMNSLSFDFLLRFRVGSTINFTHISRVAAPHPEESQSVLTVSTISNAGSERLPVWNREACFESLWKMDRSVAEAYGLDADDFEHILGTFPVFARKRPAFFAYLQERLQEWRDE